MEDKSNLERLREAWENAPGGAKKLLYDKFGHNNQNVRNVLQKGRKDESIIIELLDQLKVCSDEIANGVTEQNNLVQSV